MFVWQAHAGAVTALAFGPDGRFLASAGADRCVRVWDPLTGTLQLEFALARPDRSSGAAPRGLVCSADGGTIVVGHDGCALTFLDATGGGGTFTRQFAQVVALKGHPNGQSVFALIRPDADPWTHLTQYPLTAGPALHSLPASYGSAFAVSTDGRRVLVDVYLGVWPPAPPWQPAPPPYRRRLDFRGYTPSDLTFSGDDRHVFALVGGKVVVYEQRDRSFKTKLKGHNGRITAQAVAPDGRRLWTASHDASVRCWDACALTLDRIYTFRTGGLDCLAVAPDGNVGAVGSGQKGTIALWDLA
jgi:WD40 repeat protein